jgi:hypothetical protein
MGGTEKQIYTNGICFTFEATEYFIYHLSEADWLMRICGSTCAGASKTQLPLFVSATLAMN